MKDKILSYKDKNLYPIIVFRIFTSLKIPFGTIKGQFYYTLIP